MSLRGPVLESAAEAAAAAAAAAAAEAAEDEDSVKGGAEAKAGGDSCSAGAHDLMRASTLSVGVKKRAEKGGGWGESATGEASAGVLGDKGVTTDKPCCWGACVFDKVPVLSSREVQGAAGR
jgi:hypothetical protein